MIVRAGRTWCDRGNVVRGNTFRRFLTTEKLAQTTSVNGIYLVRHPSRHYPLSPCLPPVARGWTAPAPALPPPRHLDPPLYVLLLRLAIAGGAEH